jgi:hypothetical protein
MLMKLIVTHTSPDWDAIGSVWVIKKYLPGWHEASVVFVPAGQRLTSYPTKWKPVAEPAEKAWDGDPIETIDGYEVLQVDTGMGPLDHHQVFDTTVSGAGLSWNYVQEQLKAAGGTFTHEHIEAMSRVVQFIVETDHFKEVFWDNPAADYHEFSLLGLMEGIKLMKPNADEYYLQFGIECLDAMLHNFENRIWAEKEINEKGQIFETKWGKAIGFDTVNDSVLKLAQKMGYKVVVRKDPRKGYVRIKASPCDEQKDEIDIDLTLVAEKLRKIDPEATWYLHVSKKMLLNGTPKNPNMIPTTLSLDKIIDVIKSI